MFSIGNYNFRNFYNSKQKKNIKFFFVLSLIGMFLEMLGISLFIPLLSILIDPLYSDKIINYTNNYGFYFTSQNDLILFLQLSFSKLGFLELYQKVLKLFPHLLYQLIYIIKL